MSSKYKFSLELVTITAVFQIRGTMLTIVFGTEKNYPSQIIKNNFFYKN